MKRGQQISVNKICVINARNDRPAVRWIAMKMIAERAQAAITPEDNPQTLLSDVRRSPSLERVFSYVKSYEMNRICLRVSFRLKAPPTKRILIRRARDKIDAENWQRLEFTKIF